MVATRRTSLRLQEKTTTGDCTLPPFTDDELTPTRARKAAGGDSATKKSPRTGSASKAKTPPQRSAAKKTEDELVKEEALEVKDELAKELFQDEKRSLGADGSPATAAAAGKQAGGDSGQEASASDATPASADSDATEDEGREAADAQSAAESTDGDEAVAAPPAQKTGSVGESEDENGEEEEEIVMMDSDDDDDADDGENDAKDDGAGVDGEEEDISAYVLMAASGLNLSTSKSGASAPASSAARRRTQLVPDALESGASQHAAYFEFQGHAKGATLVAAQRTKEEQATLRAQMHVAAHAQRQRAEHENTKSAGRKWFDMASQELTADARRDFALLRMRNYLDPKKFYKTSDHSKKLPKHFQMGVVVEGAHEFKSARLTKKERQQTFTDEIMADAAIQTYTKRVFGQIQASRSGQGKKKAKTSRH